MQVDSWTIGVLVSVTIGVASGCAGSRPDFRGPIADSSSGQPITAAPDSAPSVEVSSLIEHVEILTSPAFAGRLPLTAGGRLAGDYVAERFAEAGLMPWENEKNYAQRFGVGINMIAVLPGSDPVLADQFVVLSAHYDHLGTENGAVFPGAADNAAGVAVLLETARVLANSPRRPARSVVFAAFDAEEQGLYGSYLFTAREDFDTARFAGLVNLDMLGRATFGVRSDTLIAVGTRRYPRLRATLQAAGEDAGLDVLPIGRELVGPRSDHVAFEPMGRPWVFLTCGPFADYHTPRDTPDKLDYSLIERSTAVVLDAVTWLADAPAVEPPTESTTGDRAELDAVIELTARMPEALPPQFAPAVTATHSQAVALRDAPAYRLEDNALMHQTLSMAMTPIVYGRMLSFTEMSWVMQARKFYVEETDRYVAERSASIVESYGDPDVVHLQVVPEGAPKHSHE